MEDRMSGCPLNFIQRREHHASKCAWNPCYTSTSFFSNRLDMAQNLYRRDLFAHFGCVNAIEFSQEGCWLISGGDDRRVLLWNLESSLSNNFKPMAMKEEHSSNIFCLSFDSCNSKIFSAGNDEQVIVHDVQTGEAVNVFMHEEAIYGVSVNPYVDSVFASAGEDGQILIFDIRAPASVEPLLLARSYDAFHAVQFHPVEPMFVVTANSKEGVALWDVRKPRIPFVKYGEKRSSESSMCARFNSDGSQIIALRRRMHPVLFNTHSAAPVCEFDADHYYNSCTMKSCCFAGSRDQFVLSGSDDFNLYMWRIPDPHSGENFIGEAHLVLKGHRSIVNQVRFNVHNFTIASSGVEKIVKLWSPVSVPGACGAINNENTDSTMTRRVYTHEDYIGLVLDSGQTVSHDYSHGNTDEDPKMMAFFDSLVQREVEGWTTNTDLSDDDDDDDDVDDDAAGARSHSSSSQSDVDSDSAWASPEPRMMFSPLRRLRPSRTANRNPNSSSDPVEEEWRKPVQGSEWILKLIAKKRAQLKAAKAKKRAQLKAAKKNLRPIKKKRKSKARQFIQCFTSSRQYLYRPESNRATNSNGSNRAAPADLLRRRHTVAPYTMMSLSHLEDEEESESEEENGAHQRPASLPSPLGTLRREPIGGSGSSSNSSLSVAESAEAGTRLQNKKSLEIGLWSFESDTSEDDEGIGQDTAANRTHPCIEIPRVSDPVNSGVIEGANSVSSRNSELLSANRSFPLRTSETGLGSEDVGTVGDIGGAVPISAVSMDETGAVLFVSEDSSRESSCSNMCNNFEVSFVSKKAQEGQSSSMGNNLHLWKKRCRSQTISRQQESRNRPNVEPFEDSDEEDFATTSVPPPSVPDEEDPQSRSSTENEDEGASGLTYGLSASTPDSGISLGERAEKCVEDSPSELEGKQKRPCFRKKKGSEFRNKNYRSRLSDDDMEEGRP